MDVFTLRNANGLEMRVTNYGGAVLSLRVPDRYGALEDVVLGFAAPEDYRDNPAYFGTLIGRYANRIAHGSFELDGRTWSLARDGGSHHLHGGPGGFHAVTWETERDTTGGDGTLVLRHTSPGGDQGYPGTLRAEVRYTLTEEDQVVIDYHATTDTATPVNLTHHSYFNLAGAATAGRPGAVLDHVLTAAADAFTPVDNTLIPTGEIRDVSGTPFDFREPTPLGARIEQEDEQLQRGGGYDHNLVLSHSGGRPSPAEPPFAARLYEPTSGRTLEIFTSEPGLQLYTANALDGSRAGKGGIHYAARSGVALETQHFPDSPNQPAFPSTILRPGTIHRSRTIFAFGTR